MGARTIPQRLGGNESRPARLGKTGNRMKRKPVRSPFTDHVYQLVDLRNNVVMYVGKTQYPRQRLIQHLNQKMKSTCEWIKELSGCGLVPIMNIVWKGPYVGLSFPACQKEREFIEAQVDAGNTLLLINAHNKTNRKFANAVICDISEVEAQSS